MRLDGNWVCHWRWQVLWDNVNYAFCVAGIMLPSSHPQMPPLNILSPTKLTSKKSSRSFSSAPKEEFIRYEPPTIMIQTTKDSFSSFFQPNFWFSSKLVCGEPAPDVLLQAIPFQHKRFFRWIFFVFGFVFISVCVLCCVCLSLVQHKRFFRWIFFVWEVNIIKRLQNLYGGNTMKQSWQKKFNHIFSRKETA